jgi:hypothetical protein
MGGERNLNEALNQALKLEAAKIRSSIISKIAGVDMGAF